MPSQVVIGLSGGMDSATLCAYYIDKGCKVLPISFSYGSKHNFYERIAAEKLAKFYGLIIKEIDLNFIGQLFKSNLLKTGGEIPQGYYTDANMSQTVVPGRNLIFISIMTGYAWSEEADIIAIGVHAGDHFIYEDCRAGFVAAMNAAVIQGSGDRVRLEAPFQYLNKSQILNIGYHCTPQVPYHLTRTCYKDQELSCGKCGSCQERLEAFINCGSKDPINYER
jgi:7-cyano-7-deazaguanine synthase